MRSLPPRTTAVLIHTRCRLEQFTTNRFMEHLCKMYSFQSYGNKDASLPFSTYIYSKYTHAPNAAFDTALADHWEAYIAALWVSRGRRAVEEFLAPLIYQAAMETQDVWLDCLPNLTMTERVLGIESTSPALVLPTCPDQRGTPENEAPTPSLAPEPPSPPLPTPTPTPTPPNPLPVRPRPPTLFTSSAKVTSSALNLHFKNADDAIAHLGDRLRAADSEHCLFNTGTHWTFRTAEGMVAIPLESSPSVQRLKQGLITLAHKKGLITLNS